MTDDHTDHGLGLGLALLQEEAATVKSPATPPIQPLPAEAAAATTTSGASAAVATTEVLPINLKLSFIEKLTLR